MERTMRGSGRRVALSAILLLAGSAAQAQLTTPGIPSGPSYGYQPYNPSQPTGLNHPNDQGFGTYHNPTRLKGYRSPTLAHRRFRGY